MLRSLTIALAAGLISGATAGAVPSQGPRTASLDHPPTAAEDVVVRRVLGRSFGKEWSDYERTEHRPVTFSVGHADLNGDGRPDLLVLLTDSGFGYCGSAGCAGYAILATSGGYAATPIDLATFGGKVTLLAASHKGMHDLRYDDAHKIFRWDGAAYR